MPSSNLKLTLSKLPSLLLLGDIFSEPAFAHTGALAGHLHIEGFFSGLSHPISGIDHLVVMIAVGLLSASQFRQTLFTLPILFITSMIVGGLLGIWGFSLAYTEAAIALSAIILGLFASYSGKVSKPVLIGAVLFFALFHGHAHGSEIPASVPGLAYFFGFLIMTMTLQLLGIAFTLFMEWSNLRIITRTLANSIAAIGLFFLAKL